MPQLPPHHTNRLIHESSPYLLQHAHNPVDWYAWGPEAFEAARQAGKPIFLSVGYSTCYWCHVMERQSFENAQIAAEMNDKFISIKVDREERPDVDQLYMLAVQVLTRQGGWPMSVFLTPDLRPFYGGTYFPPTDAHGRPGFLTVLRGIDNAWHTRQDDVNSSANQLVTILQQLAEPPEPEAPITIDDDFMDDLVRRSIGDYDPRHGGFGGAPKFPRQTLLEFLLAYTTTLGGNAELQEAAHDRRDKEILRQVLHTLDAMADGGIRDQLGGAFHRYSTDAQWLVPHFEIMLYDNAMLAWIYTEAYRQTENRRYAAVARGILDFILREMTSPQGAFYTAFDAEVDAREGQSYLWTPQQVRTVLGEEDAALFNRVYGLDRGFNFSDPHHGTGEADQNILYCPEPLETVAARMSLTEEELAARLEPMRQKLYAVRRQRQQPLLDTKILTSWNAMAIRALAYTGGILAEPRYLEAAAKAARYLLHHHRTREGVLLRTSRPDVSPAVSMPDTEVLVSTPTDERSAATAVDAPALEVSAPDSDGGHAAAVGPTASILPRAPIAGFLDDYAALLQALLALQDTDGQEIWGEEAAGIAAMMQIQFGSASGGLYFTAKEATDLIVRQKLASDSPLPSGNALAAMGLLELGQRDRALAILTAFAQPLQQQGESMSAMAQAALIYLRRYGAFTVAAGENAGKVERPVAPEQVAAGVVSMTAAWADPDRLNVHLDILDTFHINAHEASAGLVATELSVGGELARVVEAIDYPPGEEQGFTFSDRPIRVYSGRVVLSIRFKPQHSAAEGPVQLALRYQACNDSACFPPVSKRLSVGLA